MLWIARSDTAPRARDPAATPSLPGGHSRLAVGVRLGPVLRVDVDATRSQGFRFGRAADACPRHLPVTLRLTAFADLITVPAVELAAAGMPRTASSMSPTRQSFLRRPTAPRGRPRLAHVGFVAPRGSRPVAGSRKLMEVVRGGIRDHELVIFDFSAGTQRSTAPPGCSEGGPKRPDPVANGS